MVGYECGSIKWEVVITVMDDTVIKLISSSSPLYVIVPKDYTNDFENKEVNFNNFHMQHYTSLIYRFL